MVPPLRGRRAADGAQEKAGHSGRDDNGENAKEIARVADLKVGHYSLQESESQRR
jgi:hypothetical protein